ncbi:UBP-type zinc finger domain-containing protein [Cellulomonas sp. SG140]|uniref:UBP-type zinc finger domain-containing protein n=1 Tax=Cellulomonas sp. SG140 TaxID=2976536 RepID=UPI0021E9798E|nr:UBP-type zinc finger domain-containing protein [Cellulomonas sp. SG140]
MTEQPAPLVDPAVPPSGTGCAECDATGGWWLKLRRCAACGHVGCCDSSPGQHATAHWRATGHRYMRSFEPGESWWWDYAAESYAEGPELAPPTHRPVEQDSPGPAGRVPENWHQLLH